MTLSNTPINSQNDSKLDRIRKFQRLRIFHHHLNQAIDESKLYIEFQDEPTVILLYGPSGAGKTTAVEYLIRTIIKEHESEMQSDPGHIPVAYVRTMAPSKREFNWRYFYYLANKSIGDPFPLHKTRYKPLEALSQETFNYHKNDTTEIEYIDSLISNIKNRGVHVMFVDEAQHLAEGATWQSIQKQMNHIKTFTDAAGSLIFLCGTYDLLPFRAQNGQLGRRVIEVHLPRYRFNDDRQRGWFEKAVLEFEQAMPFEKKPDLLSNLDLLYLHSVGCIGVLKQWLNRAVILAVAKDDPTVESRHLIRSLKSVDACEKMAEEIRLGELALKTTPASTARLRLLLGMDEPPDTDSDYIPKPRKRSVPVGSRKPTRDITGKID